MTHTKQLLLVTFCSTTAGIGASFRTHGRRTENGRTDRRGSRNSYLDVKEVLASQAHPRCANTHNFLGLTWEVNISEAATV